MLPRFRFLAVALLLNAATSAFAQNVFSIRGTVVEATGAAVPSLEVTLETRTGVPIAQTQADSAGNFVFTGLGAADLIVAVPASSGFATQKVPLHLSANIAGLKITLSLASVSQEVTVGNSQALSTETSANRDTITTSGDQLRKLPVFDQNYIAALTPFLDASSGSSGGVTLIVDGVEMKSSGVSASAIQEVRINNDPYSAEFSRPGRGRIEITTKPGSPVFHGEANFLLLDSIFNAKAFPAVIKPPKLRAIFEGHLSGPVGFSGHTSFIASGSYRLRNASVVVDAVGPSGPILENVLAPTRDSQDSIRVTHDFSASHRLSLGYNFEYYTGTNAGVGGLTLPEAGYNESSREDDLIFNDRIIVTPNLVNQLLVTFEKDEDNTASVTYARSIQVSGSFIGGGAQADLARTENTVHLNEIVSWSHGRHYLRAGVQLPQLSRRAVDDHTNRLGTLSYASLANYPANPSTDLGTPYVFTAQEGIGRGLYWINEFGSFLQDQIKLNPKLQISLGLRYDWQTYLSDNNNLSPRVSLAYAPGNGKTILRLGTGIFYDRTGGDFPATFKLHNGLVLDSVQLQNPTAQQLASGTNFSAVPSNIVREASNIRAPYAIQSSFGIERQLNKKITLTAAYRNSVQVKSFRSRDVNAPILPPNPDLTADYPRPNPAFGQIQQIESGGRSLLNALDLSFRGQAGRWFSGQAQYTLSRFENNTGGIRAFPQDQYHPNSEWGRANQDALQRFNLMGNINPDHWLSLGVNASLYSGSPYTETTGTDDFHTGLGNARPAGVGRNTLQAGGLASLDLIYSHDFYLTKVKDDNAHVLSAGLSAFNVLNRSNYTSYIGTVSSTRFMRPTSAQPGRQMQFSIGYRF